MIPIKQKRYMQKISRQLQTNREKIDQYNNSDCVGCEVYESQLNSEHQRLLKIISDFLWGSDGKVVPITFKRR
jgi:hypothetical protein